MPRAKRETPVCDVVRTRKSDLLIEILAGGADPNETDRDGRTPLMETVAVDNLEMFEVLMRNGADVNVRDKGGWTALHFAAQDYRVDMARRLLEQGAEIDPRDSYGNTPLFRAVFDSRGRGEMIDLLLAHGADRAADNDHGVSPETLARRIANYPVAQFFDPAE